MSLITLEAIKQEQAKIAEMIATFEANAAEVGHGLYLPEITIDMRRGEEYAGIILGKDGANSHHLILLPDAANNIIWPAAADWAKQAGGDLPTRREQALLYANLKEHFEPEWYWSCEQRASDPDWAWGQDFGDGSQGNGGKGSKLRARAVRRLVIE